MSSMTCDNTIFSKMTTLSSFICRFMLSLAVVSPAVYAANDCKPVKWSWNGARAVSTDSEVSDGIFSLADSIQPGEINCRFWGYTGKEVNYYTCTELARRFEIENDKFFSLNPDLEKDCSNIEPQSKYCVVGFIEPLRAINGLCGPKNNNATCRGTGLSCCNAETFTCGNTTADCADGTCGYQNGKRGCTGKWGDCCNLDGRCGTGDDFCADEVCQSGKCQRPSKPQQPVPWLQGNTTDGSCGGPQKYTCDVVYGNCCNMNGQCASSPADCGLEFGCQPEFGNCNAVTTTSAVPTTTQTSPPTTTSGTLVCASGTVSEGYSGNLLGLCDFSCYLGFCPSPVCTCLTQTATGNPEPATNGKAGCPADEFTGDPDYTELCAFVCNHDYCPEAACQLC